jgi:hypothetical protein
MSISKTLFPIYLKFLIEIINIKNLENFYPYKQYYFLKIFITICNFTYTGHMRDDLHNLSIFNERKKSKNLFLSGCHC